MPYPRHRDLDDSARYTPGRTIAALSLTGRPPTQAEARRRQRAGHRSPQKGHLDPWWTETRNGLPWRPYRYRGTGRDAYDGSDLFEEAS